MNNPKPRLVPEGVSPLLDQLAALGSRIDVAYKRTKRIRRGEWVEGSLELAAAFVEARALFITMEAFQDWLAISGHDHVEKKQHVELLKLGSDLELAKKMFEVATKRSYYHVWHDGQKLLEEKPARERKVKLKIAKAAKKARAVLGVRESDDLPPTLKKTIEAIDSLTADGIPVNEGSVMIRAGVSHVTAEKALTLRRYAAASLAMREDYEPPAPKPRAAERRPHEHRVIHGLGSVVNALAAPLTREQVDPDFKGTPTEWVDKYGHVQITTAEGYATSRFGDLVSDIRALSQRAKAFEERKKIDLEWLRSPKPYDVSKLIDAMIILRPLIAEAEAALAKAEEALLTKGKSDVDKD